MNSVTRKKKDEPIEDLYQTTDTRVHTTGRKQATVAAAVAPTGIRLLALEEVHRLVLVI
jgi:hypothetical protein